LEIFIPKGIKISYSPVVLFTIGEQGIKDILKEEIPRGFSLNWRGMYLEKSNPQYENKIIYP